jgi:glycosyltransferase involved in cell wall biosynthesis
MPLKTGVTIEMRIWSPGRAGILGHPVTRVSQLGFIEAASGAPTTTEPAVSVIVPTRNYARYLPDSIASVRAQTLESWECIVVDDGSTDGTAELLKDLAAEEPRLIGMSQPRRGVSAARNAGLRKARGTLIQFLDADDLLPPEKLAIHAEILRGQPQTDLVYGPSAYFDDEAPTNLRDRLRADGPALGGGLDGPGPVMLRYLLDANPMTIEAPLVRRSILERVGGLDEDLDRMEDWDLWLRCAISDARFAFAPARAAAVKVRVHPASTSQDMVSMLQSMIIVRRKIGSILQRREDRALNARRLDELRAHVAMLIGRNGDPLAGLRYVIPAIVSGRRPRGIRTAVRLTAELTGVPQLVRRRSSRNPSPPDGA